MIEIKDWIELVGTIVDAVGVVVIVVGLLVASARYVPTASRGVDFRKYRQDLGKAILLGLEILIAGDIIKTVAATPTLTTVGVLAGIVFIRTFLSFTLEVELEGRWPWQRKDGTGSTEEQQKAGSPR